MELFEQIEGIIVTLASVIKELKKGKMLEGVIQDTLCMVEEINECLYYSKVLKFQKNYNIDNQNELYEFIKELEYIISLWSSTLERRKGKAIDVQFWEIYEFFSYVDITRIYSLIVNHFKNMPKEWKEQYVTLQTRYTFLKGKINDKEGDYSLIQQHVEMMVKNIENYKWLYEHLEDYRSKAVLNGVIKYWFDFQIQGLRNICETTFKDYYDLDILQITGEEIVVDLGAYIGDSVIQYAAECGRYKKIYAYELTPSTYKNLVKNVESLPNVIPMQKGVGAKKGVACINDNENDAGNKITNHGNTEVEIVTLDEEIKESISIIKMDIEGAEKEALSGARRHIINEKPQLLISAYHIPEDIFEIPQLINGIRDDYKFYMRFNGRGCLWPCDYVLFAV